MTGPDLSVFAPYLERTRWFGGKGRTFEVTAARRLALLGTGDPTLDVLVVDLRYGDHEGEAESYQVPLSYYTEPEHRLDHAFVGWWEDPDLGWVHAYDALHDREATRLWLDGFSSDGAASTSLEFHRLPGFDVAPDATGSLFAGEQSNSSVMFGDQAVLKVFRKLPAGPNPDVTIHEALTAAGSTHVAQLYGWVEADGTHLGMLQEFLRTATDGFDLALGSVRNVFADTSPGGEFATTEIMIDPGGGFSGESGRLGVALREVHGVLREHFEVGTTDAAGTAQQMTARLTAAIGVAPALAEHETALRALYARLADVGSVQTQRVHGDLHLGQTLRTTSGWKIVDFEGEPAKTLEERLLPDSPWRDVAGMLRSFDYAPHVAEHQQDTDGADATERRTLGDEWVARNQRAFLEAYAGGELNAEQRTVVDAYTADKAVYETVYETRNRPTWVDIPLAAVARIGAA